MMIICAYPSISSVCDGYFTLRTSSHVRCDKCGQKRTIEECNKEETTLAVEVSTVKDSDILALFGKLAENKQTHPTHFVQVMLYMR